MKKQVRFWIVALLLIAFIADCGNSGGGGGTTAVSDSTIAIKLPKTGQNTCYDNAGAVINCMNTGQDGALQKGVAWPNPRFTTNADTSVTDDLTGLVWAPDGNLMPTRDSGWDADGKADDGMVTWQHAIDYVAKLNAENYLGHNDWRVPNRKELKSLVNYGQSNAATWLNTQGFTNAQAYGYWSSTSYTSNAGYAWIVYMYDGVMASNDKAVNEYVWPVRDGQSAGAPADQPGTGQTICYNSAGAVIICTNTGQDGALQIGVAWPSPRFTNADNSTPINNSVVVDHLTGLMWTKDSNAPGPAVCAPAAVKTWQGALDYEACLNTNSYLGYADWRLPDINELESLVNAGQSNAATWLNTQGFTNVQAEKYWSSTSYASSAGYTWFVGMYGGGVGYSYKTNGHYVWPVRAGQ